MHVSPTKKRGIQRQYFRPKHGIISLTIIVCASKTILTVRVSHCLSLAEFKNTGLLRQQGRTCCSPTQVKNLNRGGATGAQIRLLGHLLTSFHTQSLTHTHKHTSLLRYLCTFMRVHCCSAFYASALLLMLECQLTLVHGSTQVLCSSASLCTIDEFFLHDNQESSGHIHWWVLCT